MKLARTIALQVATSIGPKTQWQRYAMLYSSLDGPGPVQRHLSTGEGLQGRLGHEGSTEEDRCWAADIFRDLQESDQEQGEEGP
eukprot:6496959-Heterocapsa_arctica.AAC.1